MSDKRGIEEVVLATVMLAVGIMYVLLLVWTR
jgi:hypothetical protein